MFTISRLNVITLQMQRNVFKCRRIAIDVERSHAVGAFVLTKLFFEELREVRWRYCEISQSPEIGLFCMRCSPSDDIEAPDKRNSLSPIWIGNTFRAGKTMGMEGSDNVRGPAVLRWSSDVSIPLSAALDVSEVSVFDRGRVLVPL